MPAIRPSRSDSLPRVAETCFWLMTSRSIGRAPELICFARVSASLCEKSPLIWAPFRPSMPLG